MCSRCSSAWSLDMGEEEEPVCEDLPTGVKALSSGTTVSNLYLEKGYYRVSAESRSIPECYNEDACVGGDTVGQYCAPGYQGPCKCERIGALAPLLHECEPNLMFAFSLDAKSNHVSRMPMLVHCFLCSGLRFRSENCSLRNRHANFAV